MMAFSASQSLKSLDRNAIMKAQTKCFGSAGNTPKRGQSKGAIDAMSIASSAGVYQILCVPTGKSYVGSSTNIAMRWRGHLHLLRKGKHTNRYLQRAWTRHGESAFRWSVLEVTCPEVRIERETYWIQHLHTADRDFGFNLTAMPTQPSVVSDETRARMAAAKKKPGAMAAIIKRNKERIYTPEMRARFSRPCPPEIRARIAAKLRGSVLPEQTRLKISEALRGRAVSEATRTKIGSSNARKQFLITGPDGTTYHINNLTAFCREHDLSASNLCNVAKGKRPHHKGWTCVLIDTMEAAA